MMVALVAIAVGLSLGALSGGSVLGLVEVSLRFEWLVLVLFVVQAISRGRIAGIGASAIGIAVWAFTCLALLAFLSPDVRRPGVWIVGVGIALNMLVVLVNGGMPIILPESAVSSTTVASVAQSMGFYQMAGPGTVLTALGDVIVLGWGGYRALMSCGDVLLAIGVAVFIVDAMANDSVTRARAQA